MKKTETSVIYCPGSNVSTARQSLESLIRLLETIAANMFLKSKLTIELSTLYQNFHATPITFHNTVFLNNCTFSTFLDMKPRLAVT